MNKRAFLIGDHFKTHSTSLPHALGYKGGALRTPTSSLLMSGPSEGLLVAQGVSKTPHLNSEAPKVVTQVPIYTILWASGPETPRKSQKESFQGSAKNFPKIPEKSLKNTQNSTKSCSGSFYFFA